MSRVLALHDAPGGGVALRAAALGLGAVVVAGVLAWQPWLAAGVVFGAVLLYVTVTWPLVVVGVTLALGPVDLSFVTGGFKGLLPQLGGLDMNGIRLVGVTAGLSMVLLSDRRMLARLWSPEARWYVIFLAYAGATLAVSPDPLEGLRLLFKLAYPLLVFLIVSAPGRRREDVDRVTDWVLIGAVVYQLVNPFLVAAGGYEIDVEGNLRVRAWGLHHNPFSFYLLTVMLICLGRFTVRAQRRYIVLAAVAAVWVGLTLTRITLLAGLVGLGGMALYGAVVARNYRVAVGAATLAGLLFALLLPMTLERTFGYVPTPGQLLAMVREPMVLYETMSWSGRDIFWPLLMAAWATSPVFGLGMGTSTAILQANFPPEYGLVAHNEYIRLGTDTGLLGNGLFFVAMVAWLRAVVRVSRSAIPAVREYALPALASILAWAVISATDNAFDYYTPFTQFVGFLLGGAVVAARAGEEEEAR